MGWQEVLVEDRRASGPAEIAACRIDSSAWLASLPDRNRDIAEQLLATSESTTAAARQFGLTAGRVSQLRRELQTRLGGLRGRQDAYQLGACCRVIATPYWHHRCGIVSDARVGSLESVRVASHKRTRLALWIVRRDPGRCRLPVVEAPWAA